MPPLSLIEGDNFFHGTHFVNSYMRNICLFNRNSRLFSVSWFALWGQPGHSKNSGIISHTFYLWLDAPWLYLCLFCQQPVYFGVVRTMSLIWQKKACWNIFYVVMTFLPTKHVTLYLVLFFIPLGSDSFTLKTLNWQWLINMHCTCIQVH